LVPADSINQLLNVVIASCLYCVNSEFVTFDLFLCWRSISSWPVFMSLKPVKLIIYNKKGFDAVREVQLITSFIEKRYHTQGIASLLF
jgi:hypothetical protein